MIIFTKQERVVLLSLVAVILLGSALHLCFYKYPELKDIVNLMDGQKLISKVDINTASQKELEDIPYIGTYTAIKIIEYRSDNGNIAELKQLKNIKGIKNKNYEKFKQYLKIKE